MIADRSSVSNAYFEYTYSPYLYSHFYSEGTFNADLINYFLKAHKLKKANTQVIVAGLYDIPKIDFDIAFSSKITQLIKDVAWTYPVMANYQSIITRDEIIYSQKMKGKNTLMSDLASNMDIYNFSDLSFQISHAIVQSQTLDLNKALNSDSITIFGELLHHISGQEKSLMYKLMLDLVIPIGVYKILFDEKLAFVHKLLLSTSTIEVDGNLLTDATSELCTLINVPGETSCLIESEIGTSQLIDIKAEDVFILPLASQSQVKVLLKNQSTGTRELKVSGGRLGLIIDTRSKSSSTYDADILNSPLVRKLDEALVNLLD